MKCPECTKNHKASEGMRCSCGYKFAFNPKENRKEMTDGRFFAIVRRASANGTYHFTLGMLYRAHCRKLRESGLKNLNLGCGFLTLVGTVIALLVSQENYGWGARAAAIAGSVFAAFVIFYWISRRSITQKPPPLENLKRHVMHWLSAGKPMDLLLQKPELGEPPPEWKEEDVYDYGVERVLIVEHDILVDLFVKNHFHSEQRALVLSESGYPGYIASRVRELLAERPTLPVFLLHDSTSRGAGMKQRIERGDLFPEPPRNLIDLGLFPDDVAKIKRLRWARPDRKGNAVPVDYLPYALLASGLALALVDGVPFADLIARSLDASSSSDMDAGGSFG